MCAVSIWAKDFGSHSLVLRVVFDLAEFARWSRQDHLRPILTKVELTEAVDLTPNAGDAWTRLLLVFHRADLFQQNSTLHDRSFQTRLEACGGVGNRARSAAGPQHETSET
jgi:hypothetical protein